LIVQDGLQCNSQSGPWLSHSFVELIAAKMSWSSVPLIEVESPYAVIEHVMEDCMFDSPSALMNILSPSLIVPMSRWLMLELSLGPVNCLAATLCKVFGQAFVRK